MAKFDSVNFENVFEQFCFGLLLLNIHNYFVLKETVLSVYSTFWYHNHLVYLDCLDRLRHIDIPFIEGERWTLPQCRADMNCKRVFVLPSSSPCVLFLCTCIVSTNVIITLLLTVYFISLNTSDIYKTSTTPSYSMPIPAQKSRGNSALGGRIFPHNAQNGFSLFSSF